MEVNIKLKKLHPGQQQVLNQKKRFNVLCCGRRWGKSELAQDIMTNDALPGDPVGYFAPTYKLLSSTFEQLAATLNPVTERSHENQFIELQGGGKIEFWSLENELAGRSRKYRTAIIDEAAFARNLWKSWTESIRATLTDLKGDAWFLSTPKGKNDFFRLYSKKEEDNWAAWQMSTYTNPFIDAEEIDDAKKDLPESAFNQEYLALFLDNAANPFGTNHIQQCIFPISENPPVCFGVDLAKSFDYTVIIGLDQYGSVCYFDRFQSDWRKTTQKIIALPAGDIAIDSTGVGDPIAEDVAAERETELFRFTSQSKQQLMEGLAKAIQERKVTFPEGFITDELNNFEYQFTRTGVRYSAPAGLHDDCVCALALAWHKFRNSYAAGSGSISISFVGGNDSSVSERIERFSRRDW